MAAAAAVPDVCSVLVVEDDADSRESLTRFLGQAGCLVRGTATVGEALLLIEEWEPTHILLDLMLPDAGGNVILRSIRRRNLPVRIALITAAGPASLMVTDALRSKPDAVFYKPLVFRDIQNWLEQPE